MPSANPDRTMAGKLGILAGSGPLPERLVEVCRRQGREVFVLAFVGQTEPAAVEGTEHAWIRLGAAASGLKILKQSGVADLVMAGPVMRPSLSELKPDLHTANWLARTGASLLGDDGLLSGVVRRLEQEGFTVVGIDQLLGDLMVEARTYGKLEPDGMARADIARGIAVAQRLGTEDVGHAVVVQQGLVLAVEALEGTDALLARSGELRRHGPGGVLVKVKKPQQDNRTDLPAIGTRTIAGARAAGLRGIALEAGGALIIDRAAVVEAADAAELFLVGVPIEP